MVYADDLNYWKTSKSPPDTWIDKAKKQIENLGGKVLAEGFGMESGKSAFMIGFEIGGEKFKAIWPVMQPYNEKDEIAARRQAATMLYHDIKAKCLAAVVKGPRVAFFEYLMLPDGRTAAHASNVELLKGIPTMLLLSED